MLYKDLSLHSLLFYFSATWKKPAAHQRSFLSVLLRLRAVNMAMYINGRISEACSFATAGIRNRKLRAMGITSRSCRIPCFNGTRTMALFKVTKLAVRQVLPVEQWYLSWTWRVKHTTTTGWMRIGKECRPSPSQGMMTYSWIVNNWKFISQDVAR